MSDPRRNLPSASNAAADSLCPGRHLAQIGLPEQSSSDADFGTGVHRAMDGDFDGLSQEQIDTAEQAIEIERRVLAGWIGMDAPFKSQREQRLWLRDPETLLRVASGQLDAFWIEPGEPKRALIEDVKSLWGDTSDAAVNMQLRDYAVLLWANHDVDDITVFINQPKVTSRPTLVRYTRHDLERALADTLARVKRSMDPNAPRVLGEVQCKYCRAKGTPRCPESQALVRQVAQVQINSTTWAELSADEKSEWGIKAGVAIGVGERILGLVKSELEAGGEIPGFRLKEGATRRSVTDPQAAYTALADKIEPAEFAGCCTVKISELETTVRRKHSLSVKDAKALLDERLSGIVEAKQNKPSLERVKV